MESKSNKAGYLKELWNTTGTNWHLAPVGARPDMIFHLGGAKDERYHSIIVLMARCGFFEMCLKRKKEHEQTREVDGQTIYEFDMPHVSPDTLREFMRVLYCGYEGDRASRIWFDSYIELVNFHRELAVPIPPYDLLGISAVLYADHRRFRTWALKVDINGVDKVFEVPLKTEEDALYSLRPDQIERLNMVMGIEGLITSFRVQAVKNQRRQQRGELGSITINNTHTFADFDVKRIFRYSRGDDEWDIDFIFQRVVESRF
jgi:hypothetical protein